MRKYRGICTEKGKEGEWEYGALFDEPIPALNLLTPPYIINEEGCWRVDKDTVGQDTGVRDRNGIYIYEGDRIRVKRFHTEREITVIYDEGGFGWYEEEIDCMEYLGEYVEDSLEVID